MIAPTFDRRGLIEAWGRGTLKIAGSMQESGLAPPEVAVRAGAAVVIFTMPARTPGITPGESPTEILDLRAAPLELSVPDPATTQRTAEREPRDQLD